MTNQEFDELCKEHKENPLRGLPLWPLILFAMGFCIVFLGIPMFFFEHDTELVRQWACRHGHNPDEIGITLERPPWWEYPYDK